MWTVVNLYRIAFGRIVEGWVEVDGLGRMEPPTGGTGAAPSEGTPVTGRPDSPMAERPATGEPRAEGAARR